MLNSYIRRISTISGIIGIVQSVIWSILCILQFCYYSEAIGPPSFPERASYRNILQNGIYDLFIRDDTELLNFTQRNNIYVNGKVTLSLAITFFVFSLFWLGLSIGLVRIAAGRQIHRNGWLLICWSFVTLLISVLDVIATGILVSDYDSAVDLAYECLHCVVYPVAVGVVLSIACRGIILWIINCLLAVLLLYLLQNSIKDFGDDPENSDQSWYMRMGFFRFKIPRPRLATYMHKIRNPNEWWIFENSEPSESSRNTSRATSGRTPDGRR